MKLELAYNEMSFLRDLVGKKKLELIRSYLPRNATLEQANKLDAMFIEPQYSDGGYDYPCLSEHHLCARLLRKFQELEDSCKRALGVK